MKNVYRKAALERLSSPDRLDTMLKITTPQSWIALAAAAALAAAVVVWSFAGSLPETLSVSGVVMEDGASSVLCPVELSTARQLKPGMEARVYDAVTGSYLEAQVADIVLNTQDTSQDASQEAAAAAALCTLTDTTTEKEQMLAGEQVQVEIVVSRSAPIAKVFPVFGGGQ